MSTTLLFNGEPSHGPDAPTRLMSYLSGNAMRVGNLPFQPNCTLLNYDDFYLVSWPNLIYCKLGFVVLNELKKLELLNCIDVLITCGLCFYVYMWFLVCKRILFERAARPFIGFFLLLSCIDMSYTIPANMLIFVILEFNIRLLLNYINENAAFWYRRARRLYPTFGMIIDGWIIILSIPELLFWSALEWLKPLHKWLCTIYWIFKILCEKPRPEPRGPIRLQSYDWQPADVTDDYVTCYFEPWMFVMWAPPINLRIVSFDSRIHPRSNGHYSYLVPLDSGIPHTFLEKMPFRVYEKLYLSYKLKRKLAFKLVFNRFCKAIDSRRYHLWSKFWKLFRRRTFCPYDRDLTLERWVHVNSPNGIEGLRPPYIRYDDEGDKPMRFVEDLNPETVMGYDFEDFEDLEFQSPDLESNVSLALFAMNMRGLYSAFCDKRWLDVMTFSGNIYKTSVEYGLTEHYDMLEFFSELSEMSLSDLLVHQGPADYVSGFVDVAERFFPQETTGEFVLFKAFASLISSIFTSHLFKTLPAACGGFVTMLNETCQNVGSIGTIWERLAAFMKMVLSRIRAFLDSGDFSDLFKSSSLNDWTFEVHEFLGKHVEVNAKAKTSPVTSMNLADELIAKYNKFQTSSASGKIGDLHRALFHTLLVRRSKFLTLINSQLPRKEPFSIWLIGSPGAGKTTLIDILSNVGVRALHSRESTASDVYNVPAGAKHWNGVFNPFCVHFNDVSSSPHTAQDEPRLGDTLRNAVDTIPFFTPQASLDDKEHCVITPNIIAVTSNDKGLDLSKQGASWEKLIRRYPNVWEVSIEGEDAKSVNLTAANISKYRDKIVYKRLVMVEERGVLRFVPLTSFPPIVGQARFCLWFEKEFLDHQDKKSFGDIVTECPFKIPEQDHSLDKVCSRNCPYLKSDDDLALPPKSEMITLERSIRANALKEANDEREKEKVAQNVRNKKQWPRVKHQGPHPLDAVPNCPNGECYMSHVNAKFAGTDCFGSLPCDVSIFNDSHLAFLILSRAYRDRPVILSTSLVCLAFLSAYFLYLVNTYLIYFACISLIVALIYFKTKFDKTMADTFGLEISLKQLIEAKFFGHGIPHLIVGEVKKATLRKAAVALASMFTFVGGMSVAYTYLFREELTKSKETSLKDILTMTPPPTVEMQGLPPTTMKNPISLSEADLLSPATSHHMHHVGVKDPLTKPWNVPIGSVYLSKAMNSTTLEDLINKAKDNTVSLFTPDGVNRGVAFMINSRILLCNTHILVNIVKAGSAFKFTPKVYVDKKARNVYSCAVDASNHFSVPGRDISFIRVCTTLGFHNFEKSFYTAGECGTNVWIDDKRLVATRRKVKFPDQNIVVEAFVYSHQYEGLCGHPLIAYHDYHSEHGCLVGIHSAADESVSPPVGISTPVTNNDIMEAIRKLGSSHEEVSVLKMFQGSDPFVSSPRMRLACDVGNDIPCTFLGSFGPNTSKKSPSDVVRTSYATMFEPKMEIPLTIPNLQTDGFIKDGLFISPENHHCKSFEDYMLSWRPSEFTSAVMDYLSDIPLTAKQTPLTLSQCINGAGDYIGPINHSSSMGTARHFYNLKSDVVTQEFVTAELIESLNVLREGFKKGPMVLYQKACLKDEPIKASKAEILKFRFFKVSEIPHLLLCRQYLAPLVEFLYLNKEWSEAYGVWNPASPQFGSMVKCLTKFKHYAFSDISHMDSSHKQVVADSVAEIFKGLARHVGYNEVDQTIVYNLLRSVVMSIVDFRNDLYLFTEGMGSGLYVTYIFNCIVLSILYRIAWYRISSEKFRSCNTLVNGGDDSARSTSNPKFDSIFITKVFKDLGYTMTPASKNGTSQLFEPLDDLVFLQRTVGIINGRIVGKLKLQSIYKNLCFRLKSRHVTEPEQMKQKVDAAFRELALHGKEVYDEHVELFKNLDSYGYVFVPWENIIERYFNFDFMSEEGPTL